MLRAVQLKIHTPGEQLNQSKQLIIVPKVTKKKAYNEEPENSFIGQTSTKQFFSNELKMAFPYSKFRFHRLPVLDTSCKSKKARVSMPESSQPR